MTAALTPTQAWQATVPELPPVDGPHAIAERLLLLLHYGIDWETSWVADPQRSGLVGHHSFGARCGPSPGAIRAATPSIMAGGAP